MTSNGRIVLCADDFAISRGVSDGILDLAEKGRLSATSAMVTTAHWPVYAKALKALRHELAVGLHLNLTFGRALGPMQELSSDGKMPRLNTLMRLATASAANRNKIASEVELQLNHFESELGFVPDFIDGHHHVHALPVIRHIVLAALDSHPRCASILIRDPSDRLASIVLRRVAVAKALGASVLAFGFRQLAIAKGFPTNIGFSGFSTFGPVPYEREFEACLRYPGPSHIVMCHPGFADNESEAQDMIAQRRREEYELLSERSDITGMIWRRNEPGNAINS